MRFSILAVCMLFYLTPTAEAATYVIRPDGTGDFPTIQAAVDAAVTGDVIALTDGIFTGDGNRDVDVQGKEITIRSQSGDPASCILDAEGSEMEPHRGFLFVSGEPDGAVLEGVTVRGGWADYPDMGAAVRCDAGSSPTFRSCVFRENRRTAVACGRGCAPSFTDCVFANNDGWRFPGAVMLHFEGALTFTRCDFIENVTEGEGGGILGYSTVAELTACRFIRNRADNGSAAAFHDGSRVTARDCLFEDNVAAGHGGALVSWISGPNVVERCTFVGNTAGSEGAAIWSEKVSHTTVRNCTFWANASPTGTVVAGNYRFVIENSIIAGSLEGPGVESFYDYAELSCCDIFGNAGGDWVGSIADQYGVRGNICLDPLFCEPEAGDFRLEASSPCAPFSPQNPECDLAGAWPVGCGATATRPTTWGTIKALYGR